ncbi:MAG: HAD-IIB family hydrolase [Betaproteobacteria bacterium]|nr:HAD-IIB family hydrolase [Betaproteobacteria bacterium]
MKPLQELDTSGVRVVLFDVDDTLTTQGKLTAEAYGALEKLQRASFRTVAVSGRAAAFCDYAARMWPVDAVIGENGGFCYRFADGEMHREYRESPEVRAENRKRFGAIAQAIVAAVPGCILASDEHYRKTDFAIDYAEEVALPFESAERIAELMRREGLHTAISSIHVHGWFGNYDKLVTSRDLLARHFQLDGIQSALYVGDSPNDAPMFGFFPKSVGVANVRRFVGRLPAEPKYVTQASYGAGFAELVAYLLRR